MAKVCSIDDCIRVVHAKGYCQMHHKRWWSHGDPLSTINAPRDMGMRERFERIGWDVTETDCWEWRGGRDDRGYGQFRAPGKSWIASRAAHHIYNASIPDGMLVRHKCDNPPCVNPSHLEAGTTADNIEDKVSKGRQSKGVDIYTNKLSVEQVLSIKRQLAAGGKTGRIAVAHGVSPATISDIKVGRTWAWLNQSHQESVAA